MINTTLSVRAHILKLPPRHSCIVLDRLSTGGAKFAAGSSADGSAGDALQASPVLPPTAASWTPPQPHSSAPPLPPSPVRASIAPPSQAAGTRGGMSRAVDDMDIDDTPSPTRHDDVTPERRGGALVGASDVAAALPTPLQLTQPPPPLPLPPLPSPSPASREAVPQPSQHAPPIPPPMSFVAHQVAAVAPPQPGAPVPVAAPSTPAAVSVATAVGTVAPGPVGGGGGVVFYPLILPVVVAQPVAINAAPVDGGDAAWSAAAVQSSPGVQAIHIAAAMLAERRQREGVATPPVPPTHPVPAYIPGGRSGRAGAAHHPHQDGHHGAYRRQLPIPAYVPGGQQRMTRTGSEDSGEGSPAYDPTRAPGYYTRPRLDHLGRPVP